MNLTIEQRMVLVLNQHTRSNISDCDCKKWGVNHGHIGQSHGAHIIEELERVGLRVVEA